MRYMSYQEMGLAPKKETLHAYKRVHGDQKRETEKAFLYRIGIEDKWIPKSIISDVSKTSFLAPRWFLDKEEIRFEEEPHIALRESRKRQRKNRRKKRKQGA